MFIFGLYFHITDIDRAVFDTVDDANELEWLYLDWRSDQINGDDAGTRTHIDRTEQAEQSTRFLDFTRGL